VIPCYNQGRFLRDAIESALQQTHPAVEVVVIDDGSTDDTATIARMYPAARLIAQRNQGTAVARNAGLRESRGEYLIFLDADDRLLPAAVATGIQALALHPEWGFVTGHVRLIGPDGSPAGIPPQEHADGDGYIGLLRWNYIWTPGVVVYRRAVFDAVRPFASSAGGSADYELNVRIARRFAIGCHHRVVLEYRQHGANMSADPRHMLKSAVSVRRSQRKYVRGRRTAMQAWQEGIRIVQADFGERVVDQVKADVRVAGRRGRALRGLMCLLRYYPAGVTRIVSAGVRGLLANARRHRAPPNRPHRHG
jgi:glycosyltransferase involved in cell wall biosynthesis